VSDFASNAKAAAQIAHMDAVRLMAEAVNAAKPDLDLVVKIYNATKDVAQAVPDKKDPRAGLPTISITFVGNRAQVAAVPAPLEVLEEVQPPDLPSLGMDLPTEGTPAEAPLALPEPQPKVYDIKPLTDDLDALLEGL
jgi:hypothetical protein